MSCDCRCHAYGPGSHVTCDVGPEQPGGTRSCSPCDGQSDEVEKPPEPCRRCGAKPGQPHTHVEGDCLLPHSYAADRHHPPAARAGWCCTGCVHRHRDWLNQILDLWALLPEVVPLGSVPDDTAEHGHTKKAPASPAPFRVTAWALLYGRIRSSVRAGDGWQLHDAELEAAVLGAHLPNVPERLTRWAAAATAAGARATNSSAGSTVTASVIQLRAAAEHIAAQAWVDEYDAELAWIRRALRNAHGLTDGKPLGRCLSVTAGRECHGHVWPAPGDIPKCDRCGRRYGTLELVRLRMTEQEAG